MVFSKLLGKKKHEVGIKKIFGENVAYDLAQFSAKSWYPYLFLILRNLPQNFEN